MNKVDRLKDGSWIQENRLPVSGQKRVCPNCTASGTLVSCLGYDRKPVLHCCECATDFIPEIRQVGMCNRGGFLVTKIIPL